jgi:hypothetical protein
MAIAMESEFLFKAINRLSEACPQLNFGCEAENFACFPGVAYHPHLPCGSRLVKDNL